LSVINNTATLNSQLIKWLDTYCPEYLERVTGREFSDLIHGLVGLDILKAAKHIEYIVGVEGNEKLLEALGFDLLRII